MLHQFAPAHGEVFRCYCDGGGGVGGAQGEGGCEADYACAKDEEVWWGWGGHSALLGSLGLDSFND
jgi:hypothetical protein